MASNSTGTTDMGSTSARAASRSSRSRRPQLRGDLLLASLAEQVDQLIKENQQLKRDLARAERGQSAGLGSAARALAGLQRRVSRQLGGGSTTRRRATAPSAEPARRPRRKVTDPELLERRRQSLEKARAARAAKREAARG